MQEAFDCTYRSVDLSIKNGYRLLLLLLISVIKLTFAEQTKSEGHAVRIIGIVVIGTTARINVTEVIAIASVR